MKKSMIFLFGIFLCMVFAGCGERIIVNGVSYRILSKEEERAMVSFARLTLLNSEKDLTLQQRAFITHNEPVIRLSYKGDKSGRASYEWCCSDDVMFRVNCDGEFLTENQSVNTRRINLKEDLKAGQGSNLERLTLKEIEF